jgi:2-haloacid dehalogenase
VATVVFDLNGTLTDPAALAAAWGGSAPAGFGASALDEAVMMAMADTLDGGFRRFPDLLRGALLRRAELAGIPTEPVEAAMTQAATLPPRPDAAAALDHLREHGHAIAVLTNSAAAAARKTLDAADLALRVDRLDGADAVRAYKPSPKVYALTVEPADAWFVAAHWWDVTGAARAGFSTAWISVDDRVLPCTAPEPDISADSLLTAARAIVDREAGRA